MTFVRDDDTILSTGNRLSLLKASTGSIIESGIFMQDFYPRISALGPVSAHVAVPNTDKKEMKIWEATKREVIH